MYKDTYRQKLGKSFYKACYLPLPQQVNSMALKNTRLARAENLPKEIQDKVDRIKKLEQAKELLKQRNWEKINLTDSDIRGFRS